MSRDEWRIHSLAKQTWDKIESGIAADPRVFEEIISIDMNDPKQNFPSSFARSKSNMPPPVYTDRDTHDPAIHYYNSLA